MILFTDSVSGLVLDSLDVELLDGAEVDEDGRTITANIYDSNIVLSSGQIDALFNSNMALLEVKMNSYDNQNTAVKLYTFGLSFKCFHIKFKFKPSFFS